MRSLGYAASGQAVAQYGYNALEQRVLKTIPGAPPTVIAYHYGPGGLLLGESDGGGSPIREYVWLGDLPVAQIEAAGPVLYFVHADRLGTPDKLSDGTRAIVWDAAPTPWGEVETQGGTVQVNLRLPGQYHDPETGLHYNWHRNYDPATGRYMQSDPIGLAGGINRFAYVEGNPVNLTDPTGEAVPLLIQGGLALARAAAPHVGRAAAGALTAMGISDHLSKLLDPCGEELGLRDHLMGIVGMLPGARYGKLAKQAATGAAVDDSQSTRQGSRPRAGPRGRKRL